MLYDDPSERAMKYDGTCWKCHGNPRLCDGVSGECGALSEFARKAKAFPNLVSPGKKIDLNTSIYCPYDVSHDGGDPLCDHDFPPDPEIDEDRDVSATWECTRCGLRITCGVWQ